MDLPLRYDITIPQRATFRERIQLPIDCTDRQVVAQVWEVRNGQRMNKVLDFSVEWVSRSVPIAVTVNGASATVVYGDFWLVCNASETSKLVRQGVWDLLVINGSTWPSAGERTYWLEGAVNVNPGMSEAVP